MNKLLILIKEAIRFDNDKWLYEYINNNRYTELYTEDGYDKDVYVIDKFDVINGKVMAIYEENSKIKMGRINYIIPFAGSATS